MFCHAKSAGVDVQFGSERELYGSFEKKVNIYSNSGC